MIRSKIKKIREQVLENRPVLKAILKQNSGKSLFEYWEELWCGRCDQGIHQARQTEFIQVIHAEAERLFGEKVATELSLQLKECPILSTADHHGPINHPFFLDAHLLTGSVYPDRYIPVLACAQVSMNNSSFPRGVFYHSSNIRLRRFSLFNHGDNSPVFGHPKYDRLKTFGLDDLSYEARSLIESIYSDPRILSAADYPDQISLSNFDLFKRILPDSKGLITLQLEKISIELLKLHLDKQNSPIYKILFDQSCRETAFELFDGIQSAFTKNTKRGTFMFWGFKDHKRTQLWPEGRSLAGADSSSSYHLEMDPGALRYALDHNEVIPSNVLCLILISLYYGITCLGGFSQIEYLPEIQSAYLKLLRSIDNHQEAFAVEQIDTRGFGADIAFVSVMSRGKYALASGIDCTLHNKPDFSQKVIAAAKSARLKNGIDLLLPELYKIIYKADSEISVDQIAKTSLANGRLDIPLTEERQNCMYCGANQISHHREWLQQNMEILTSPGRRMVIYNPIGSMLQAIVDAGIDGCIRIAAKFGFIEYNTDPERIVNSRGQEIFKEAQARGLSIRELRPGGNPADLYEVIIADKPYIFKGLPRPIGYSNAALEWSDDKSILKKKLRAAGLPVADGDSAFSWQGALKIFRDINKPVIVKPRLGSRGRHTTTFIHTKQELRKACLIAKQLCSWVIVEEHLIGAVYRGTVIDGKCIGVLGGDPPHVTGDGIKTIAELIAAQNLAKNPGVKDIVIDEKMEWFLSRSSCSLETVLPVGRTIDLTEKIGVSYGGSSFEVTKETHPDNIKMFEEAAAVIKDPLLGFDFIVPDIAKSWKEQRCGIIECNAVPFINLHHDPLHGTPINAAKYVWDMIEHPAMKIKS